MQDFIRIRGARTHNLKNVDLDIPRGKIVVITGLSGSGKSSIAFDTLYAESQRRYAESLSSYARRFMEVLDKPDVESIEGLSPSIAIEQHSAPAGARSTVGTMTEVNDYLRILFARAGVPYCPEHDVPLAKSGIHDMVDAVLAEPEGTRIAILCDPRVPFDMPLRTAVEKFAAKGYARVRIDGTIYTLEDIPAEMLAEKAGAWEIELVIDRLKSSDAQRARLADSFETAVKAGEGLAFYLNMQTGVMHRFHTRYCCPTCGATMPDLVPAMFSFNNPLGACPRCEGAGSVEGFDPDLVLRDGAISLRRGAVCGCTPSQKNNFDEISRVFAAMDWSLDVPFCELPENAKAFVMYGQKTPELQELSDFAGAIPMLEKQWKSARSEAVRVGMRVMRRVMTCSACGGARHRSEVAHIYIGTPDKRSTMLELLAMPLDRLLEHLRTLSFDERRACIAAPLLEEVIKRVGFLVNVGLGYLTLDRPAATLSGGEVQRIRLAGQVGAGLTGVTYILDEPTIGLHQRDTRRVIQTLRALADLGNSVIVVEHDPEMMLAADWIVDMGPGAGVQGGSVVAAGTLEEVCACPASRTGRWLSRADRTIINTAREGMFTSTSPALVLKGATGHNLKNVTCRFPVGALSVVTGVSGSGKSSLVNDTLAAHLKRRLNRAQCESLPFEEIEGVDYFDKIIEVDQSPIGRTPRSNPATYTGVMTAIRELFAQTPAAQQRGYGPGRFSFNAEGGSCEACGGDGQTKIEMGILPPVYVTCPTCRGRRFNRETLEVKFKGKSIADVLDMTVDEALEFFSAQPVIARRLQTLSDVGLGYIGLGQSAVTLSGGEAQRIKLADELARRDTGKTIYVLDEPTTGLHFDDVAALMKVLRCLTDLGNTVVVIEHNLDVVAGADWVVDVGPEGGARGGEIVFEGTPTELLACSQSLTGRCLAEAMQVGAAPAVKPAGVRRKASAARSRKSKKTTEA